MKRFFIDLALAILFVTLFAGPAAVIMYLKG